MESLYLLIPMSLGVVAFIVFVLYWCVKSGQFDDLEGPGHSILMDDDTSPPTTLVQDKSQVSNKTL